MYQPFKEAFKKELGVCSQEDPFLQVCKELIPESSWEEIVSKARPLREKNFFWEPSPRRPYFYPEEPWPPRDLRVKVWLTSEYLEWHSPGVSKELVRRLREGRFSIKRTLNLRGLFVDEALFALEEFFREAIFNQEKCVLIIHGRGLSSKREPVLKTLVKNWLIRGPFRRYVLDFTSARPCDGGAGATYVLLSSRPLKKR